MVSSLLFFFFLNVITLLPSTRSSVEDGLESEYKQKLESVWYPEANTEKLHLYSWKGWQCCLYCNQAEK